MMKLKKRKAVSPVIAGLLLIAIAVAASVVTYSWVMSMTKTQGGRAQTSLGIDNVQLDLYNSESQVKIWIRNSGSVPAMIKTFYLYSGETLIAQNNSINHPIPAGDLHEVGFTDDSAAWETGNIAAPVNKVVLSVTFTTDLAVSTAYKVKIVTDNGFSIEGVFYTPTSFS